MTKITLFSQVLQLLPKSRLKTDWKSYTTTNSYEFYIKRIYIEDSNYFSFPKTQRRKANRKAIRKRNRCNFLQNTVQIKKTYHEIT